MRVATVALLALAGLGAACSKSDAGQAPHAARGQGRYIGIGIYQPGRLWRQLAGPETAKDPAAARRDDDDQIIVVTDSRTGEIRQCGNHSGSCIAMNPWTGPGVVPALPALLRKHGADLDAEEKARQEEWEARAKNARRQR